MLLHRRRLIARTLLASALLACGLLYCDPQSSLLPPCPIHQAFGILCPGCGATRALAALLRGHLREALRLNALFVLLLPAALGWTAMVYHRATRPGRFDWPRLPAPTLYATLIATVFFTLARNLGR